MYNVNRKSSFLFFITLVLLFSIFFFFSQASFLFAQTSDLVIQNYQLVSKTRVGRTSYDYVFKADVKNNGTADAINVTATLTSLASTTTVIDSSLSFGIVPKETTVKSSDTFTVRIDRLYQFSQSNLSWEINYDYAYKDPNQLAIGLREAVQVGDVDKITKHFDEEYRDKYRSLFEANIDKLSELSEYLNTLEEVKTGEKISVYKFEFIDDEGDLLTNQILFKKDQDGNWRIIAF